MGENEEKEKKRKTYLALVEDVYGRATAAENLGVVLVDRALGVAHGGDVLDHDDVVRMLALSLFAALGLLLLRGGIVQQAVGVHHVVHDTGLGDLLGLELALSREVLAVVVAEMVVGRDGERLDARIDEELCEDGLELGLTRLEVVTTDERLVLLGQLDDTRDKGVLGGTVDKGLALENGSDGKDGGRRNLGVRSADRVEHVLGGIVDTGDDVAVTFGVGGPEDDDAIEVVVLLELADIGADVLEVSLLVVAGDQVVGAGLLVGRDEVGVVDGGEGLAEKSHVGGDLALEVIIQDLGAHHGLVEGHTRDVPTSENEIIGVDHGENIGDGDVDLLASLWIGTDLDCGCTKDGANVVGTLATFLGVPGDVVTIGEDSGTKS